ncbi:hypothetical protein NQ314_000669 [Rhamnusium bicolor]|uniref:snRNA-activating protein complex subunit 4 n=1 Tax=Rhamnusium bicolor TaxID=1586634 RepID=A0AAV8ZXI1_9CUCU|nr:hypothetical protein NQ314_000669 [Rhamnusium bicolor]
MDDEEDVMKMIEFLKCSKEENVQEYQYEEFINCDGSDAEEIDTNINIEDSIGDEIIYTDLSNTDISRFHSYDPRNSLKPDERAVIDSCPDAELKNILLLNRTQNMQLIQLYKKMKDLLIECQQNIIKKTDIIKEHVTANKDQTNSTGAWRLAAPYFKDKQLYPSPSNAETIRKKNNNELCIYDLSILPKWSTVECEKLIRAVKLNYNINQQNEVVKAIQKAKQDNNLELLKELEERKKELKENDNSEIPPEVAKRYEFQNWDQIAKDLGTNRTGFTVCMNYFGNLHDRFKKGEFTHQEDSRLLELVQQYKMGSYIPWTKIVQHFKKRTRSQLHYRYTYYLSQHDKRRGKFTDAEDILLMIIVDKFGKNYKKCCEYLPTRSMVQCKARYSTNLQNSLKKGSFTVEEDEIIMKYVEKHGSKSWTNLTDKLHRSRGQIRQRYITIKQFLDANPDKEIAAVTRRKHNLKSEEESFHSLRAIADEYRDNPTIPTLDEIEAVLKRRTSNKDIVNSDEVDSDVEEIATTSNVSFAGTPANDMGVDDLLTAFFCNSFKVNTTKMISSLNLRRAVNSVKSLLDILKAKLDIPENFDEDMTLDNLDVAILNSLSEENSNMCEYNVGSADSITDLVPPNLNTVVGLRSLLIKFSHYRSEEKQAMTKFIQGAQRQSSTAIRSDVVRHFLSLPPDIKQEVAADRKLFYKRFHALFKWPAIMTLENPSAELQSTAKGFTPRAPIDVKRTYSRQPKNSPPVKRVKVTELPSTSSAAAPLKLTPVTNKSVLEDLLRDKTKKLFYFDKVVSGGKTKTIIKQIPLPSINKQLTSNGSSGKNIDITSSVVKKDYSSKICCEKASGSNQESSHFDTEHGECVIMDTDDDTESVATGIDGSIIDDEEDLKKLNTFLGSEYMEDQCEGNAFFLN